jgi:hypothetical protein
MKHNRTEGSRQYALDGAPKITYPRVTCADDEALTFLC